MKSYLGFAEGMFVGMSRPKGSFKFFDWEKAKKIVEENPDSVIYAGLQEDWGYTSGLIYAKGKYYSGGSFYGCSTWATPIIDVDGEEIECWTHEETETRENMPSWWGNGQELLSEYDYEEDE